MTRIIFFFLRRLKKFKFKKWVLLEHQAHQVDEALSKNISMYATLMYAYIKSAVHIPAWILDKLEWTTVIAIYYSIRSMNAPTKIPLLTSKTHTKDAAVPWDYDGRNWHYWSHTLAKQYGWSLEQIAQMEVDDALAHIQEILVDEQLGREFQWSMSEIAYPYNPASKKSEFKALERPYFMWPPAPKVVKTKMLKMLQPQGLVRDKSGMDKALNGETTKLS